jgi:hypothetical protein
VGSVVDPIGDLLADHQCKIIESVGERRVEAGECRSSDLLFRTDDEVSLASSDEPGWGNGRKN